MRLTGNQCERSALAYVLPEWQPPKARSSGPCPELPRHALGSLQRLIRRTESPTRGSTGTESVHRDRRPRFGRERPLSTDRSASAQGRGPKAAQCPGQTRLASYRAISSLHPLCSAPRLISMLRQCTGTEASQWVFTISDFGSKQLT